MGLVRTRDSQGQWTEFGNRVSILLVPRIWTLTEEQTSSIPPRRLTPRAFFTNARNFGGEYIGKDRSMGRDEPTSNTVQGEEYDLELGLLVAPIERITVVTGPDVLPSSEELKLFWESGFLPVDLYRETHAKMRQDRLGLGTRVKVTYGDFIDMIGIVRERKEDSQECLVELPYDDLTVYIHIRDLRAYFKIGDKVTVISGPHRGFTGWVVETCFQNRTLRAINSEKVDAPIEVRLEAL